VVAAALGLSVVAAHGTDSVGCKIVPGLTDSRQFGILQSGPGWEDRMHLRRRDFITLAGVTVWSQQQ
jgi:hypothetical protein